MQPNAKWTILPHGEITRLADNLHTVVGRLPMPFGETTRLMTIASLARGRLAIYSAIALDEAKMRELEALGEPAFLIVPSAIHRLDVKPWKMRYPNIVVVAPIGALEEVNEIVSVDATEVDLGDPRVGLDVVAGTDGRELAMLVETDTGKTLVVNDLIFNLPKTKGVAGFGLRVLGFGPGKPSIPPLVRMKLVKDKSAVRAQLRAWAKLEGLERLIVSHGEPIENPKETLLGLAEAS
jgi:hypothetical protein